MRHPRFVSRVERSNGDFCTRDGAERLAAMIRAAWARAGHFVTVEVVQITPVGHKDPLFAPRMSGLVNGLPTT